MTKEEIIAEIVSETGFTAVAVKDIVNNVFEIITREINDGNVVRIRNFGTFSQRIAKEKVARNLKTGETVVIPEHTVVKFRAGKRMKEL